MSYRKLLSFFVLWLTVSTCFADILYTVDTNREYPVVISESDENGTLLNTYTYGNGFLPLMRTDTVRGETFTYITNQNHVLAVTNESGKLVAEYGYDAFGKVLYMRGPEARLEDLIFGGNRYDPTTGHYHARARDYDPNVGRFTQMDTWKGIPQAPITLHKYLYAYSDPVNFIDPSGMFGISSIGAALRVNGRLSTLATSSGRATISRALTGSGKDAFGIVGEEIIQLAKESMLNILLAELSGGTSFANAGARGTAAHQQFERLIGEINEKYKRYGYVIKAEVFRDSTGNPGKQVKKRAKGSVGIDVEIRDLKGKPVLAFDLKTGKGMSGKRNRKLQGVFGSDIIEIFVSKK
ncbi:RHS repeat-associated core domain-containing protein [Pleionea sp. CnH1-48]|uniref:RHS repeat-associated core domain-containing protein n=1 Tax=Pleionea sp. CnH1-48 TaxID=2954494 RepID=UPI0020970F8F|nr:RHS repeat-associated core domain-containing protein [Pleionea sp. CnH1-48]MCO7225068.1 RHS repeat-associated core domain-containing protein [Pleionea sp. CnH1-48]